MITYEYVKELDNPFFLVIGAMDGISHDNLSPIIREMDISGGLFVEPIKHMFNKLKENYINYDNIYFENSAITDKTGKSNMYRIDFDNKNIYPEWCDGGSSLVPDKTAMRNVKNLQEEEVNTITLKELLYKHKVEKIDILQIDCEGYDMIIFKQFDFEKYKPQFISIEILSLCDDDIDDMYNILTENGYDYFNNGSEVLGIKINK